MTNFNIWVDSNRVSPATLNSDQPPTQGLPPPPGESDNNSSGFLTAMVTNSRNMWRGVFLFFVLIGAVILLLYLVKSIFVPKRAVTETEITSTGFKLSFDEKKEIIYLNFHSSLLWKNDPVQYSPEDSLTIKASGQYNPTIHHLVDAADKDYMPVFGWCGPDGIDNQKIVRAADAKRNSYRISKDANYACLLLQFVPKGGAPKLRPDPENLLIVNKELWLPKNRFKVKGDLYFAVNEVPLDPSMEKVYIVKPTEDREYVKHRSLKAQQSAWNKIKLQQYWNLWYDDNIGSIFISIEKQK